MTTTVYMFNPVFNIENTDEELRDFRDEVRHHQEWLKVEMETLMTLATEMTDRIHAAETKIDAAKVVIDEIRARLADATENGLTREQAVALVDELDTHVAALDAAANPAPVEPPVV